MSLTRLPVARGWAIESDEFGFLDQMPCTGSPCTTRFTCRSGAYSGTIAGDLYRGLIMLNMTTSVLALVSLWWFLRPWRTSDSGSRHLSVGVRSGLLGLR